MKASSTSSGLAQRRPRPVHSCLQCRSKKLKCDKTRPCSSCVKSHRREQCLYELPTRSKSLREDTTVLTTSQDALQETSSQRQIDHLLERIETLERKIEPPSPTNLPDTVKIKGARSRYQAVSDGIAPSFDDAREWILEPLRDTTIRNKIKALRGVFLKIDDRPSRFLETSSIKQLLPEWQQCLALVKAYFQSWENAYRVLHEPTFLEQLNGGLENLPPEVVPQLALVVLIGSNVDNVNHETLHFKNLFSSVEAWLRKLRRKERITLLTLQTECLRVIFLQTVGTSADELWKAAGTLIRSATIMGIHRDPSDTLGFNKVEAMSRRRIWFTIAELELQSSIACGFAPSDHSFSCEIPTIDVDGQDSLLHPGQGTSETRDNLQNILAASIRSRIALANTISSGIIVKKNETEALLRDVETTSKQVNDLATRSGTTGTISHMLSDISVRRLILMYHRTKLAMNKERTPEDAGQVRSKHSLAILHWLKLLDTRVDR